jgi:error-prone DNA polymerase
MSFVHLRVASGYSFKYGSAHISALVKQAAEFNMSALALTDRDKMAGAIRFAKECESVGISPILGVNLSLVQKKFRVTLLAQAGRLSHLYQFLTALNLQGEVITNKFIEVNLEHTRHLLIMHGPESQLVDALSRRRNTEASAIFNSYKELFFDQAIECVTHQVAGSGQFSTALAGRSLAFARDHKFPAVITNAVRMLTKRDGPITDVLDATRNLTPLSSRIIERSNSEGYLKSAPEMSYLADEIARAAGERNGKNLLATTLEWAEQAKLSARRDIGLGNIHLPEPTVVNSVDQGGAALLLRERCQIQLGNKYAGSKLLVSSNRLEEELAVVTKLGYETYFLTVADIVGMARDLDIRVAARGSGAGSLICYLLGISGVEPIDNGLIMERFCSITRGELPDIDIDVESARRLEIYDTIFKRYGNRVATVAMVETYRARHAIRDVGAAMGIAPMEIDLIAKSLPNIRSSNIEKALANLPELKNLNVNSKILKMAIEISGELDRLPRHLSMHPCAIAISDAGLYDRAPIEINRSGYPMMQFDKDDVEDIGLLKLDVLGVRMQSAIAYTIKEIERIENKKIDIDSVPLDDKNTFDLIKSTRTLGVFQIESPGQRELIGKFAPRNFTDLIIDISLFRPGPVKSDMISPFLGVRHGLSPMPKIHEDLTEILRETEGVVVFHDQVIKIISKLTGVTLAIADEKRRELGDFEGQQRVCDWFFPAALAKGYELSVVTKIWDVLRAFASFGFCKAHAAAFALPTYQSAWLKSNYTAAFLAGVLTHDPGMYPKRVIIDDARQWGIKILPIEINKSEKNYRVEFTEDKGRTPYKAPDLLSTGAPLTLPDARGYAIRVGLSDLSGISDNEITTIIENKPYLDLADFIYRSGAARPTVENLVKVGAFDELHNLKNSDLNRRDLALHLQDIYKLGAQKNLSGQLTFELAPPELKPSGLPDLTDGEVVRNEVDLLGIDISKHMLEFYGEFLNSIGAIRSCDLIKQRAGSSVLIAGVKVALQTPPVRSGRRVMFLTIDDGFGCNDITFFEDIQKSCAALLRNSWLFLVKGEVRRTGPRGISIRATEAWELANSYNEWRNL